MGPAGIEQLDSRVGANILWTNGFNDQNLPRGDAFDRMFEKSQNESPR